MPDNDPTPARRRRLLLDVTQAASEVSRLVHEARDLHLPVEPGVRDGATPWSAGPSCSKTSSPKPATNR